MALEMLHGSGKDISRLLDQIEPVLQGEELTTVLLTFLTGYLMIATDAAGLELTSDQLIHLTEATSRDIAARIANLDTAAIDKRLLN